METESSDVRAHSTWTPAERAATAVLGGVGVLAVHHPMLLSGFSRIQTDLGDPRLIHYLLEHGYRWAAGAALHRDFWSAPFFHPLRNVIAYSDALISFGPFYWAWRLAGAPPDLAFGLWMVLMTVLNYAAGLLLFGRGLGFGAASSAAGAALLAFGAPRVNQLGHQQLLPFFYVILTLYALARLFREGSPSPARRLWLWMMVGFGGVAQLYGGVYLGWFLAMGLILATAAALALRSTRGAVVALARRDWWAVAIAGVAGLAALGPFLAHYLAAATEMAGVYPPFRYYLHPTFGSWWNVGEGNWFWGWLMVRRPFVGPLLEHEHRLGIGFITTACCAAGLYLGRRRPWCQVAIVFAFLCLLATSFLPREELQVLAAFLLCHGFACLLRQPDEPVPAVLTAAAALGVVAGVRIPSARLQGVWLALAFMSFWKLAVSRRNVEDWGLPVVAIGVVCFKLLAWDVMALAFGPIAPAAGLLAFRLPRFRREIGLSTVALTVAGTACLMFAHRPEALVGAVGWGLVGLASSAPRRLRPSPWMLWRIVAAALATLVLVRDADSLWLGHSLSLPGGLAIRAVGRIVLVLMIPAAAGLALVVDRLALRKSAALAWAIALLCLAEQTVTTPSFDAAESRARIARVADQVRPTVSTFYYKPRGDEPYAHYQLDAMWASLEVVKPTINGYTGYFPAAWYDFLLADSKKGLPLDFLLERWESRHGLHEEDVQRISDVPPAGSEFERNQGPSVPPNESSPVMR